MRDCTRGSHGDALDDVAGDPLLPPVVDLGGLGVSVAGEVLDVLERRARIAVPFMLMKKGGAR